MDKTQANIPAPPITVNAISSRRLAKSVNRKKPIASPANANATHGKIGNSHGCGLPKTCTPLMYDSSGHGRNFGRYVVQTSGAAIATNVAEISAPAIPHFRDLLTSDALPA